MGKLEILSDPSKGSEYPDPTGTIKRLAIFPPIGIARIGDSECECFLAPEVPGRTSPPETEDGSEFKFRDKHQKLRRQAVRFRIYAYDDKDNLLGELNKENGYDLTWEVHVANKKAANVVFQRGGRFDPSNTALRNPKVQPDDKHDDRSRLIVEATGGSPALISGFTPLKGKFHGSKETPVVIELAQLQIDDVGRLVFIPGKGGARSVASPSKPHPEMTSEFDNADWIDEICDGSVSVIVKKDGTEITSSSPPTARVLSAPPNFAWGINESTTLYDIMENIYYEAGHEHVPKPDNTNLKFWKHIWPVLLSASSMSWTNNTAFQGHGKFSNGHFEAKKLFDMFKGRATDDSKKQERKQFKSRIFEKLRKPLDETDPDHNNQADVRYMPRLSGDAGDMTDAGTFPRDLQPDARRFAALTKLQYKRFEAWTDDDDFCLETPLPSPECKLEKIALTDQPRELTHAILESTTGDPLYPGIEMYWIAKLPTTYNTAESINPPFRINDTILAGHLTRGLSLPWQCDFDLCATHWWPAVRPDDIVPKVVFDATGTSSQEDFNRAITIRTKWTRGLRDTVFFSYTQTDWPGSDDMVRYWKYLGIVREVKGSFADNEEYKYTAFLEDERVSV